MRTAKGMAECIMRADEEIWDDLDIICRVSSDPNRKTVATEYSKYESVVKGWIFENGLDDISEDELDDILEILEDERFRSFYDILEKVYYGG